MRGEGLRSKFMVLVHIARKMISESPNPNRSQNSCHIPHPISLLLTVLNLFCDSREMSAIVLVELLEALACVSGFGVSRFGGIGFRVSGLVLIEPLEVGV